VSGFDRRSLDGGVHALVAIALERDGFLAAFLERGGGTSPAPFVSLNVSYGVGDDPRNVTANRRRAAEAFGVAGFAVPGLIHGTKLSAVGPERATDGFLGLAETFRAADGLHTDSANVPLAEFSADCVVAILASPRERRVAIVHAGWRGMAAGVLQRGAVLFEDRREVRVAIGPAIGPCHYEVGEEVVLAVSAGSPAGAVTRRLGARVFLDLAGTTRAILNAEGIGRVYDTGLCTACEPDRLFSFRAEGATGRHLALAMRRD